MNDVDHSEHLKHIYESLPTETLELERARQEAAIGDIIAKNSVLIEVLKEREQ